MSFFKYTVYHHIQSVSNLHEDWIPDPIQTAAMKGAVSGGSVAENVQDYIKNGGGLNLKKYYFYASKRFKKRNCNWSVQTRRLSNAEYQIGLTEGLLKALVPELQNQPYRVVEKIDKLEQMGIKFYQDMKDLTGLDYFSEPDADGNKVIFTNLIEAENVLNTTYDLGNSWVVGMEVSKNRPAILLDPNIDPTTVKDDVYVVSQASYTPTPSMGVRYWASSNPEPVLIEKSKETIYKDRTNLPSEYRLANSSLTQFKIGPVLYAEYSDWQDPTLEQSETVELLTDPFPDDDDDPDVSTNPDENNQNQVQVQTITNEETITKYYSQLLSKKTVKETRHDVQVEVTYYTYKTWTETYKITYDQEHYIWLTEDEESIPNIRDFYIENTAIQSQLSASWDNSPNHKFYPYLPIEEFDRRILNTSKAGKYTRAVRNSNNKSKRNYTESDAPAVNRAGVRKEKENKKNSKLSREDTRIMASSKRYQRKIKPNNVGRITKADDRHLNKMGELLGIDYKHIAVSMYAHGEAGKIYHTSIQPAVQLGSNFDEVNLYNYKFFERLYKLYGQSSYVNFVNAVNNITPPKKYSTLYAQVLTLPRVELNYWYQNGQTKGVLSFAFIRKFTIRGRIRKTKRKRKVCEVREGKHVCLPEIIDIDTLKQYLIDPPREMVENRYYTSSVSGKDYNIGGGDTKHSLDIFKIKDGPEPYDRKTGAAKYVYTGRMIVREGSERNNLVPELKLVWNSPEEIRAPSEREVANLMFSKFNYTFFCKPLSNGSVEVIAVAGLIGGLASSHHNMGNHGSVSIDGRAIICRARRELNMFYERNRQRYVKKVNPEKINVVAQFNNKKIKTQTGCFFIIPLDYKVVSRMSSYDVARFSGRALLTVTYLKTTTKQYKSWVGVVLRIIGFIITVIAIIYQDYGTAISIQALIQTILYAILVQIVLSVVIKLLIKVIGVRGFLALLVVLVVIIVAALFTGYFNTSSLPYASETAVSQTASTVGTQAATTASTSSMTTVATTSAVTQTITATASQSVTNMISELSNNLLTHALGNFSTSSLQQIAMKALSVVSQMANIGQKEIAKEIQKIQKQLEESTAEYDKHMAELYAIMQENKERSAPYDVKEVMSALVHKSRLVQPDYFINYTTLSDNLLASEDYLSSFIDNKIQLDPELFDPILSLDFSLKRKE